VEGAPALESLSAMGSKCGCGTSAVTPLKGGTNESTVFHVSSRISRSGSRGPSRPIPGRKEGDFRQHLGPGLRNAMRTAVRY